MATFDRSYGTTTLPSEADARLDRPMRLDWSALFGGTLIGWGVMLILALIAMIIGLAVIDPFVARPAALIVQTANRFPCDVSLVKDGQPVNAKSIMGVLMLAAPMGTTVTVRAEGEQAQECADAIAELFEKGFNEAIG